MKSTGILRRVDDLGRIVIPMELRNKLKIEEKDALEIARQKAYTDAIKKVIESISPNLIASMTSCSNAELMKSLAEAMGPYALATNESVSDVINRLLRGTSLEGLLEKLIEKE